MVRLSIALLVLIVSGLSALAIGPASAVVSPTEVQSAATTMGIDGTLLEANMEAPGIGGFVCTAPGTDDDAHACTGKTLVSPMAPLLPRAPVSDMTTATTSLSLITSDLSMDHRPPKAT